MQITPGPRTQVEQVGFASLQSYRGHFKLKPLAAVLQEEKLKLKYSQEQ